MGNLLSARRCPRVNVKVTVPAARNNVFGYVNVHVHVYEHEHVHVAGAIMRL